MKKWITAFVIAMAVAAFGLMMSAAVFGQTVPPNTARLTWDLVQVVEDNAQSNVGYRVYYQMNPCADVQAAAWLWTGGNLPAGTGTHDVAPLQDNRTFCFYVTAFTPLAESPPSNTGEKYIPFPGATPAPANFLTE